MKVLVLGAGLLGVTSAYFLRQQGHDVTVVDRQANPAAFMTTQDRKLSGETDPCSRRPTFTETFCSEKGRQGD